MFWICRSFGGQEWHSIAQQSAEIVQADHRQWRVELHHLIEQLAGAREARVGTLVLGRARDHLLNPRTDLSPRHAQQAAIMQALQQMITDIQIRAPALASAIVEMRPHILGAGVTMLTLEAQYFLDLCLHPAVPW